VAAAPLLPHAAPKAASAWLSKPFCLFLATQALALQRLKTRAQFQAVLAGATVARSEHFALHRKLLTVRAPSSAPETGPSIGAAGFVSSEPPPPVDMFRGADLWLGAMVPKRWAKRAVTRNAIKRQIYSLSAGFSPVRQPAAFVVRLRRDFSRKEYLSASSDRLKHDVRTELLALMQDGARRA
jgi:ribonuclease P protein component